MKYVAIFLNILACLLWVAACSSDGDDTDIETELEETEGEAESEEATDEANTTDTPVPEEGSTGESLPLEEDSTLPPVEEGVENVIPEETAPIEGVGSDNTFDNAGGEAIGDPNADTGISDPATDPAAADSGFGGTDSGATGTDSFGAAAADISTENVYFDTARFNISPAAQAILDSLVSALQANPAASVTITGYCDERGASGYNQTLSENRANSVKDYLINAGIDGSRLTTIGGGEIAGGPETYSENRRVEFSVN